MRVLAFVGLVCLMLVGCGRPASKTTMAMMKPVPGGTVNLVRSEDPKTELSGDDKPAKPIRKPSTTLESDDLPTLIAKLKNSDFRAEAATAIGKLGAKARSAMPDLIRALDDGDPTVRDQAASAIVAVGREPVSAVLDFTASWCGPCRQMKPIVEALEKEGLPIIAIDIDKYPDLSAKFEVHAVPTYVALKSDQQVGRTVGGTSDKELRKLVAKTGFKAGEPAKPATDDAAAQGRLLAMVLGLSDEDAWTRFGAEAALRADPKNVTLLTELLVAKHPARVRGGAVQGLLIASNGKDLPEKARQALARALSDEKESVDVRGYAAVALGSGSKPPETVAPVLVTTLSEAKSFDLRARAATRLGELRTPTALPALIKALQDDSEPVRQAAATALGKQGVAALPAVPVLLAAIAKSEDASFRQALEQICRAGDAGPMLAKALGDDNEDVRLLAVELLRQSADPTPATKELEKALMDVNLTVRVRAATVLQQIGGYDKAVLPVLIEALGISDDGLESWGALMQLGRKAVPELVKSVTAADRPAEGRLRAARLLFNLKPAKSAVATLKTALGSEDVLVRTCAALVLVHQGTADEAVIAALLASVKSKDKELRRECLQALGQSKSPAAIGPLLTALNDRDEEGQMAAAYALGQIELDPKTLDRVIALLTKKSTARAAAIVLQSAGKKSPKVVKPLVDTFLAAKDDDRDTFGSALSSLGKLAIPSLIRIAEDTGRHEEVRGAALDALHRMGPEGTDAAPKIAELLKSPSKTIRVKAAIALGNLGADPAAVPILIEALADENELIRSEACFALSRLGPKAVAAADRLIERLKTCEANDRFPLAEALGNVTRGTDKGVPALLALLRIDLEGRQGESAASILHSVGKAAIPHLIKALTDDQYARADVIQALRFFGAEAKDAAPQLVKLLGDKDRAVAIAAAQALASIDPKADAAIPVLIEALQSPDTTARMAAMGAIGQFGKAALPALPALIKSLKEPQFRATAAYTITHIGPDAAEAVEPLIAVLNTRDGAAAAHALQTIGPKAAPAIPALIKLLDRESSMTWAAATLAKLGGEGRQVIPILLKKLADDDRRLSALHALAGVVALDPEVVLNEFLKRVDDPDAECRQAAIHGLAGQKSDKVVPALIKAVDDPETEVSVAAIHVLAQAGPAAGPVVPKLIALLQSKNEGQRFAAASTLGGLGTVAEPAIPDLIKALDDKKLSGSAAHALGKIGPKGVAAIPRLIAMLDESEGRMSAIGALGDFGPAAKDALPKLRKILDNPGEDEGPEAQDAIDKIEGKKANAK